MQCYKCHGDGTIQGYSHIANGRCFMCNGSGEIHELKKKNMGYSREFISQFAGTGFFYPGDDVEKVKCISLEGHATAEGWLMRDANYFYVGQPVCHSSTWYKIPAGQLPEFAQHYNRIMKREVIN